MQSFAPAAAMVYTDLENLQGLIKPTDYGSGVEFADGILNSLFPNIDVGLQVNWLENLCPSFYQQLKKNLTSLKMNLLRLDCG